MLAAHVSRTPFPKKGPPLVNVANWLTHIEFDAQSPVWRHGFSVFSTGRTLIRYDERGSGLSDWHAADLSLDTWVSDLEAVVDALGLTHFLLLGISQASAVAVAYAARHPDRVSQLVLYGAFACGRLAGTSTPEERDEWESMLRLVQLGWDRDDPAFRQVSPRSSSRKVRRSNTVHSMTSPDCRFRSGPRTRSARLDRRRAWERRDRSACYIDASRAIAL